MEHPSVACSVAPSRGRYQSSGKAGPTVSLDGGHFAPEALCSDSKESLK